MRCLAIFRSKSDFFAAKTTIAAQKKTQQWMFWWFLAALPNAGFGAQLAFETPDHPIQSHSANFRVVSDCWLQPEGFVGKFSFAFSIWRAA